MKKLISLILLLCCVVLNAQNIEWARIEKSDVSPFFNGYASVGRFNNVYLVHRNGEKLFDIPYPLTYADNNCFIFGNGYSKALLTDHKGNALSKQYCQIEPIENLYLATTDDHKYVILNKSGEFLNDIFQSYIHYNDNTIQLFNDQKSYILDAYGTILIESSSFILYDPNSPIFEYDKGAQRLAYIKPSRLTIDITGKKIAYHTNCDYFTIHTFLKDDYQYYNFNAQPITKEQLCISKDGLYPFIQESLYGFKNKNGQVVLKPQFSKIDPLFWINNYMRVESEDSGKWGCINSLGQLIISPVYESLKPFNYCFIAEKKSNDYHVLDKNGKIIYKGNGVFSQIKKIDKINKDILLYYDGLSIYEQELININTGKVIKHSGIEPFKKGLAKIMVGSGWGLINSQGKFIIKPEYNKIYDINEDLIVATDLHHSYIFDINGKVLFNSENTGIKFCGNFNYGVAPVWMALDGNNLKYGWIYNTFTNTKENILALYPLLTKDQQQIEDMDKIVAERAAYVDYLYKMGANEMEKDHYQEASYYFYKLLKLYPTHDASRYALGYCYYRLGNYDEALEHLRDLISYTEVYYLKALCFYNQNKLIEAAKNCKYCLSKSPNDEDYKELYTAINERKQYKKQPKSDATFLIMTAINQSLATINQSMMIFNNQNTNFTPCINTSTIGEHSRAIYNQKEKKCSLCHGTGYNPGKERASFYSYSTDMKDNPPCDVCGDRSDHYHKSCPSCGGKGYTTY